MSEICCEEVVGTLLPKLRSQRVVYFPIRHHSPACAAHIERWILDNRPSAVLVEGPASFTSRINYLTDEACRCPVALYTNFIDKKGRLEKLMSARSKKRETGAKPQALSEKQGEEGDQDSDDGDEPKNQSSNVDSADSDKSDGGKPDKDARPALDFDFGPPRFAAYYPFCDYSPELIALRTGKSVGARLRFIDLEFGEMVLSRFQGKEEEPPDLVRIESLTQDSHLRHSQYINALAENLGCRDFDELWDHLFETGWQSLSTDALIDRLATYCAMARLDYTQAELTADGTIARENCMAAAICEELDKNDGIVLVVTGGFHTVVLPDLVASKARRPDKIDFSDEESGTWLMRYSFDKLDSLAGYAAGMPAPAYYDRLWHVSRSICGGSEGRADGATNNEHGGSEQTDEQSETLAPEQSAAGDQTIAGEQTVAGDKLSAQEQNRTKASEEQNKQFERIGADVLLDISRLTRERSLPNLITTPDSIAALQMSKQLALLRGHAWPMREDILDGIRSCFVKGEVSVEGQVLLALVNEVMAGNRIGQLPEGADLPPIVDDFYRQAKRLRLSVDHALKKEHALDLYRNANHRQVSRFFHRLDFLGVAFGKFLSGPDFVTGQFLTLMQEHWQTSWSPVVESSLIERALLGTTIEEAADSKLKLQISKLEESGQARSTAAAVALLVRACRLGLHAQSNLMVALIDVHIAEDAHFQSVVQGLSQLELLQHAREPLEAGNLTAVPRLMEATYLRACRLLHDLAHCPDSEVENVLAAMQTLREVMSSTERRSGQLQPGQSQPEQKDNATAFDRELFYQGLQTIIDAPPSKAQSAIVGGAAGILYAEGKLTDNELVMLVCGFLGGTLNDPRKSAGILRGLLSTACEIAWQVGEVMRALDEQFRNWDEKTFIDLLPDLRLAFSTLSPRDVARVAEGVSNLHEGKSLGELVHVDVDEGEVQFGLALNERVCEALKMDGLVNGGANGRGIDRVPDGGTDDDAGSSTGGE